MTQQARSRHRIRYFQPVEWTHRNRRRPASKQVTDDAETDAWVERTVANCFSVSDVRVLTRCHPYFAPCTPLHARLRRTFMSALFVHEAVDDGVRGTIVTLPNRSKQGRDGATRHGTLNSIQ